MVWFVSLAASPFIASMTAAIWPTSPPILMPSTRSLANKVFFHAGYSLFWPENCRRGGRICRVVVLSGSISIAVAIFTAISKLSKECIDERDEGTLNVAVLTTNDANDSVLQAIYRRAK